MKLGDTARDTITGYQGTVTALAQYLTGSERLMIEAPMKEDGSLPKGEWFDVERVSVVA